MRGQTLIKLFKAIELFSQSKGATIRELQERLKIDRKSVYRLIGTMEDLGFPLTDEKPLFEREKRWIWSMGAEAEILAPEHLRDSFLKELNSLLQRYHYERRKN